MTQVEPEVFVADISEYPGPSEVGDDDDELIHYIECHTNRAKAICGADLVGADLIEGDASCRPEFCVVCLDLYVACSCECVECQMHPDPKED